MSFKVVVDMPIPMRDGTKLMANLWIPEVDGPVPTLLVRTPYGKSMIHNYTGLSPDIFELMKRGYAVAVQECRGTFSSEGAAFVPHVHEAEDGLDTVNWLLEQDWCNGSIGTFGASYLGFVQWYLAGTGSEAIKAIAPAVTSGDPYRGPWHSSGGALSLGIVISWGLMMSLQQVMRRQPSGDAEKADMAALAIQLTQFDAVWRTTPVSEHPLVRKYLPWIIDVGIMGADRNEQWAQLSPLDHVSSFALPALHIGGWYDLFIGETLRGYLEMKANAATQEARDGQMLVIGPWAHSQNGRFAMYQDRLFGLAAAVDSSNLSNIQIAFFDRWLKGRTDALDRIAPVRLFVMGIDQWRDESAWPLEGTQYIDYYLTGAGPANSIAGTGALAIEAPGASFIDTYLYDPSRPVPSLGGTVVNMGGWDGAADQQPVHSRDDVLCFVTAVLDEAVEVIGPVGARLFVSSSAVDTDFTAKLVDIHPDGRAIILCDGIQRMRYRKSLSQPEMMSVGEVYEIAIDMTATANVFLPGHRILLEISSSNFPRYDRNSNTGGTIALEREAEMVPAVNHIHRGGAWPSRVTLPIIKR